jgi:hypothetical protein
MNADETTFSDSSIVIIARLFIIARRFSSSP